MRDGFDILIHKVEIHFFVFLENSIAERFSSFVVFNVSPHLLKNTRVYQHSAILTCSKYEVNSIAMLRSVRQKARAVNYRW